MRPIVLLIALCCCAQAQTIKKWDLPDSLAKPLRKAAMRMKGDTLPGADTVLLAVWQRAGYAEARVDSVYNIGRTTYLAADPGPNYWLDSLTISGATPGALKEANLKSDIPYYAPALAPALDKLLAVYQDMGYPFARVELKNVKYKEKTDGYLVHVAYHLSPGKQYYLSEIRIEGDIKEKPQLVYNLIKLKPKDRLNRSLIEQIPELMDNTPYFRNTEAPVILYHPDSAVLVIKTSKRKSNRFEALIGMLPAQRPGEKLQWTGMGDFRLVSPFRRGEEIALKLELLPDQSQNLDFHFSYPYLLNTPFSGGFNFSLLRRDTTFLNRTVEFSGAYQFTPYLTATFSYRRFVSSLLSTTNFRKTVWPPPPNMDSQNNLYGAGFRYQKVDYLINPKRGLYLSTELAIGTKKTKRPAGLDSLDVSRLLATQPRQELRATVRYYVPTGAFTWVAGGRYFLLRLEEYYRNDLPFLGGTYSLRGFNENQFQASQYFIGTLELRLRMSRDAYIGVFAEGGYMEQQVFSELTSDRPIGTGLSLSVPTPAGQLLVSYAVGTLSDLPFAPDKGRIHLGLAAQF